MIDRWTHRWAGARILVARQRASRVARFGELYAWFFDAIAKYQRNFERVRLELPW